MHLASVGFCRTLQADVRCLSRLPSRRPPLAEVSEGLRQPSPGAPEGLKHLPPPITRGMGAVPCPAGASAGHRLCRPPLRLPAPSFPPCGSVPPRQLFGLFFPLGHVPPRSIPVLSLRLFSPRKALQLWVSVWAAVAVCQMEASLKASGACLPPPPSSRPAHPSQPPTTGPCWPCFSGELTPCQPGSAPLPSGYRPAVLVLREQLRAGSSEPLLWWTPSCPPISGHHSYEEAACTFCVYVCQHLTPGCPASLLLFPEFECSRSFQNLGRKEAPSASPFSSPALQLGSRQLLCSASTVTWPLIWPGLQGPLCIPVRPLHHIQ